MYAIGAVAFVSNASVIEKVLASFNDSFLIGNLCRTTKGYKPRLLDYRVFTIAARKHRTSTKHCESNDKSTYKGEEVFCLLVIHRLLVIFELLHGLWNVHHGQSILAIHYQNVISPVGIRKHRGREVRSGIPHVVIVRGYHLEAARGRVGAGIGMDGDKLTVTARRTK